MSSIQLIADKAARKAALDPSQSFLIQAPAGSGKTELLVQRFLLLLSHVEEPEEIIAITFTRKAAGEMRTRVLEALENAAITSHEVSSNERLSLAQCALKRSQIKDWDLLKNPNRLRIQTIDSLCAFLARQAPTLSSIGQTEGIEEMPEVLYQKAIDAFIHSLPASENENFTTLLLHLDNDYQKLERLLLFSLSRRDTWLPYLFRYPNEVELRKQLETGLTAIRDDSFSFLNLIISENIKQKLSTLMDFAQLNLSAVFSHQKNDEKFWECAANFLLTEEGVWRKKLTQKQGFPSSSSAKNQEDKLKWTKFKKQASAFLSSLSEFEEFRLQLQEVRKLPYRAYSDSQWKMVWALFQLLPLLVAFLQIVFQSLGKVDYVEIMLAAGQALGDSEAPTDLALALDYQIKHLLIDEFQDTSFSQLNLLKQLTAGWYPEDGRTLFLVGDPMQSIYRFRKAEPGIFFQVKREGIGNIKLNYLTLAINFRSSEAIVNWNNQLFAQIFTSKLKSLTPIIFTPSLAHDILYSESKSPVCFLLENATEKHEAEKIVSLIQEILQLSPKSHIGLLVRARSHLAALLPCLKKAQINYHAVDIEPLIEQPVIQDLLSLTRALIHPADKIAWLGLLRSPLCGLKLQDIFIITQKNLHGILWDNLMQYENLSLSAEGLQQLKRVLPSLAKAHQAVRSKSFAEVIEWTWLNLGGPLTLKGDFSFVKTYFTLLHQFSLSELLSNFQQFLSILSQQYANQLPPSPTSLEIMTIHKAKGLEFDIVIIPSLHRSGRDDEAPLFFCTEQSSHAGSTHLLMAPVKSITEEEDLLYNFLRHEEKKKAEQEIQRLLYVAATRAKSTLYLFACITLKNGEIKKPPSSSLLSQLLPAFSPEQINRISFLSCSSLEATTPPLPSGIKSVPSSWEFPFKSTHKKLVARSTRRVKTRS